MDTLTAPCPYRRTDVVDGGYALLLERELQIEIEIRRVYRNEQIRAISQKIGAQLAANADDLEIVAQHFHITVHRQLFHRKQHFHACGLHLGTADANELQIGASFIQGCHQVAAEQIARCFARDNTYHNFLCHNENKINE